MTLTAEARYPYVPAIRQTGTECFKFGNQPLPVDLVSFWQWSASDLLGNTMRGCLAEYIVAMALGITSGVRNDWEAYDLQFNGLKIEVKASGYLQTWPQKRLSRPQFSINPTQGWDPVSGRMSTEVKRRSDLYVFCLHHHKDKATVNPMDVSQWTFYLLPTVRLEDSAQYKEAKTITLNRLLALKPSEVSFNDLGEGIVSLMSNVRPA